MNKLMFVAAGVAVAGSAFAVPTVYDYKASVKHTYLKEVTVNINQVSIKLYAKTQKSASLKGYLIQDTDATIRTSYDAAGAGAVIAGIDIQPRNRAFLVVRNSSAEKDFRVPRILPAVLEAKWYDTNVAKAMRARQVLGQPTSGNTGTVTTEGYLYVGGEIVATTANTALINGYDGDNIAQGTAFNRQPKLSNYGTEATTPTYATGVVPYAIDDYNFTSCFLFGKFNQPDWSYSSYVANNDTPWVAFADAWMNGAGFGKGKWSSTACCGRSSAGWDLTTLSGNLKAGLFLCSENGEYWDHTINLGIDNQYWIATDGSNCGNIDIWADGILDLGTTDVGYGTWQIKRNASFTGTALDASDRATLAGWTTYGEAWNVGATDATSLLGYIKGAASRLGGTTFFGNVMGSVDVATDAALINEAFWMNYLNY